MSSILESKRRGGKCPAQTGVRVREALVQLAEDASSYRAERGNLRADCNGLGPISAI